MTASYVFHEMPFRGTLKDDQLYLGIGDGDNNCFNDTGGALIKNILANTEKIDGVLDEGDVIINLPVMPGLDQMAGAYIIKHYIETGRTPKAALKLAEYFDTVNSSEFALNKQSIYTLYFIMTVIGQYYDNLSLFERSSVLMDKSEILFKRAMINYLLEPNYDLKTAPIAKDEPQFAAEIANAAEDFDNYISDRDNICETLHAYLPLQNGEFKCEKEKIIFWTRVPKCKLYEFWAGLDGFALCAVILSASTFTAPNQNIYPAADYKISLLNDRSGNKRNYITEPIARELEYAEYALEKEYFPGAAHSKRLRGISGSSPFSITQNPWSYNELTIISPNGGSLLTVKQLQSVIGQLISRSLSKLSYSLILPFSFPYKKYAAVCSQFQKSGWEGNPLPYDIIDHSVNPQPCCFRSETAYENLGDITFYPGISLYIYPNGAGMAVIRPDIQYNGMYADFAVNELILLKERFAEINAEKLFNQLSLVPVCKFSYLPPVSYIGILLSGQGYTETAGSSLKRYSYSLAASDNSSLYIDDIIYSPEDKSKICFDQSACAGAFIGQDGQNKCYEQFDAEWSMLMLSLLQRRCTLNDISARLNMLSPANNRVFKDTGAALLCLDSAATVPDSKAPDTAKGFYQAGAAAYRISEITSELHQRIRNIGDFLAQQSASLKITLICFAFAVLADFLLFGTGLIKLPPIIDMTGKGFSSIALVAGLGVIAGTAAVTFLMSFFIKRRRK